jgi:hypothetical protein
VDAGWFRWSAADDPAAASEIGLRGLNERWAGEKGRIVVKGAGYAHGETGEDVRFWAVNTSAHHPRQEGELAREARLLAAYGINLVRIHGAVFDGRGEIDRGIVRQIARMVRAYRAEGIYSHLSIWFPLWLKPPAGLEWLPGYDGGKFAFATLMFDPKFQEKYQGWWREVLAAPDESGKPLLDEPALMSVEIQNEDSFFFWTFEPNLIPEPHYARLQERFGSWAAARHGSIEAALEAWGTGARMEGDDPAAGRLAFRPLATMAIARTTRDRDTAAFLFELQSAFYRGQIAFLRGLGFRGLITASNWTTADAAVFGPLEKASYLAGDFLDRHGYLGSGQKGQFAEWSIRAGHTYRDRRVLRFEPEEADGDPAYLLPGVDIEYNGKPSMLSESTWCRPNRHRGEAPLHFAVYGLLQGSDAIVHFVFDGSRWSVQPQHWMQPWTLMAPAMMGQFPATALIYRGGLVDEGPVLADVELALPDLLALAGTPLPQEAALDDLRRKDIPAEQRVAASRDRIDPLVHYAGRTRVTIGETKKTVVQPLDRLVRRGEKIVAAGNGQIVLDYGRGVLRVDSPRVQAASGALAGEPVRLSMLEVQTPLDPAHVVLVPLDGLPLAASRRMLLQVMSEERNSGWKVEPAGDAGWRILDIGRDPWEVRRLEGRVALLGWENRPVTVTALDTSGMRTARRWAATAWDLEPDTVYYLVEVASPD